MDSKVVSIVIPVINESGTLPVLLDRLVQSADICDDKVEVIIAVSDRDTTDYQSLMQQDPAIRWAFDAGTSRAQQMNSAVDLCSGELLWFLHADVLPHLDSLDAIVRTYREGVRYGWFSYAFDQQDWKLAVNAWFTRFDGRHAGGGDQCIWVERTAFDSVGRYADIPIMEDFDLVERLRQTSGHPKVLRLPAQVSARKYKHNNYWKVNWTNLVALWRWRRGADLYQLKSWYRNQLGG
jgi:glycosyltransferase involved in cell wall biosynthesis